MTFKDWVDESVERCQTQPITTATRRSARAFLRGACRYINPYIGRPVWERGDWDVLVILDACRVDQMTAVVDDYDELPNEVDSVWSPASCSIDWINRTFNEHPGRASQVGYVTANPFAHNETEDEKSADLGDDDLAYFAPLYKTHWRDIKPGIATVPPEPVTDYGIQAWRDRDDHRMNQLVIHYMQPHEPYITHPEWGSGDSKLLSNLVDSDKEAGSSVWPRVQDGEIPTEELWQAGVDNLHWVLEDVTERLLPNLEGTVVLSADHGNAMGEWGDWHHPPGALAPTVKKVPWIELECTDSETVQPDTEDETVGVNSEETRSQNVEEKLTALGYR